MKLHDLLEQRSALLGKMKDSVADGDKFDAMQTELADLDKRIGRIKALEAAERTEVGTPIHGDAKLSSEIRGKFSLVRAIAGAAGLAVDNGFEREVQADLAKRAGVAPQGFLIPTEIFEIEKRVLTTSGGSDLIATEHRPDQYITALSANTIIRSLGCRVLDGLTGNLSIPMETGAPSTAWVAENSAITPSDASFDNVTLSPHHVGTISEYSRNMLLQSSPAVEQLLRDMMAREIAKAIDKAAIRGGGSNEPVGILGGVSGIQTVTGDTDLFNSCADAVALADIGNVAASRAFLTNNVVKKIAAKALDDQNRPIGIAAVFGNERVAFSNLAVNDGNSPANNPLIYADWSELMLGVWSSIDVAVNPWLDGSYQKGNISVRAMATVDVAVRHAAAFVSVTGVTNSFLAMPA